jgi:hypothetical protein
MKSSPPRQGAMHEAALSRSLEMLSRIDEIDDVKELLQLLLGKTR